MRTKKLRLLTAVLTAVSLMIGISTAYAVHPDVPLLQANGAAVTDTTPYSPKQTCSNNACHIADPTLAAKHNYGSGTKDSTHVSGVLGSDNKVYWQASKTKSFEHGVSVGRHMNQGRNEDYTNADRAAVGDPFFTSSLGMFGKY